MPRRYVVRFALTAAVMAATLFATQAHLGGNKRLGDVALASAALSSLNQVGRSAVAMGDSGQYSLALEDNWAAIDLYLRSDSRSALDEVTGHVDRSWRAYLVADQLWRLSDEGVTDPLVSEIYDAEQLLEQSPTLATVVTGQGPAARFDNAELKAVKALFAQAQNEWVTGTGLVNDMASELLQQ